jgi:hypothetical protein
VNAKGHDSGSICQTDRISIPKAFRDKIILGLPFSAANPAFFPLEMEEPLLKPHIE